MKPVAQGSRVRFVHGPIGLLSDPDGFRFAEPVAKYGDEGTYLGPHPQLDEWHMIEVLVPGEAGSFYAPVHRGQFVVILTPAH